MCIEIYMDLLTHLRVADALIKKLKGEISINDVA